MTMAFQPKADSTTGVSRVEKHVCFSRLLQVHLKRNYIYRFKAWIELCSAVDASPGAVGFLKRSALESVAVKVV